jgi:uncharacterized membrane protein YhhN
MDRAFAIGPLASSGIPASHGGGFGIGGVTSLSLVFLGLALAAGLADWWAVRRRPPGIPLEYLAKPATLALLLAAAATLHTPAGPMRGWFLPALACCLAGDVLLMLPGDRTLAFAGGLASFLAGHAFFLVGLAAGPARPAAALVAGGILLILAAVPAARILRGVVEHLGRPMVPPVVVYIGALLAMAAAAWSAALAAGDPLLAVGGSLFVVSDTLLSLDRFVRPLPHGDLAVHVTYHLAVASLVLGLAG